MNPSPARAVVFWSICVLLLASLSYAGKNSNHNGHNSSVTVSISPSNATVQTGQSFQFRASVSGTPNTAVSWLVNGIAGGTSSIGTVSSSGVYTAPTAVPGSGVTVTAQSAAQPSSSASGAVTIVAPAPPPPVTVAISPTSATLQVSQSQQFAATVSGTDTSVHWLVNGVVGGGAATGTVSSAGLYTAPATAPTTSVAVTAQSASTPSSSASASVTIAQPVQHQVGLSWSSSTSSVAGYNVYRSTQSTGSYSRINGTLETATVFTDATVASGQTYFYAVTSVDSSGTESGYSNVAQASIP